MRKRVVVTGLGLVTCLSSKREESWKLILSSRSGIRKISTFDTENLPVCIGGEVLDSESGGDFVVKEFGDPRRHDKYILYGFAASREAVLDSCLLDYPSLDKSRVGVSIGSGIGGLPLIEKNSILLHEGGPRKVSPFFIPASLINLTSGNVAIEHGFTGPNDAIVTACATGAHSVVNSYRIICNDEADVMVAGASEGALCRVGIAGFASMKALSKRNDEPEKASRPWDVNRDGFVMSDGAGILILEEYEHAKKRGAKIYAELIGFGASGDAYHIAAPHPEGDGAFASMSRAIRMSGKTLEEVDYINTHGTSTPTGDIVELNALKRLFGNSLRAGVSSTKSSIGHALGAAGGIEAVLCILAMRDSVMPPTINLDNPAEEASGFNLVPHVPQERKLNCVLSNSFGFGGTNVSLMFEKHE
ncbi:beta-ketoacyl-acyl-carrier-protein synthase II [Neorickettsia helminthoeca str. Oregon]|uniref:3-oxoacyl-[acyl-carrier-protein] synthase 2 n=1 Tax=Neorickettsia helminthoeca str. Oregon TaxID=1286528 RepID=X5HJV1_9RICK|nr:beta-ketoacyl-ACP synthase II [Neorickettsia helminthoeca]AHX11369.1 beta-ketoacyl-acyl-carrier-protein synthase II [Neorickettsia helminthoeca str. Oregon]